MSIFSRFGMSSTPREAAWESSVRNMFAGRVLGTERAEYSTSTSPAALSNHLSDLFAARFSAHTDRATAGTGLNVFDLGRFDAGSLGLNLSRPAGLDTFLNTVSAQGKVTVLAPNLPTDTQFSSQYYLRNTAGGQKDLALFRGDTSVWDEFTGEGVRVGIIDDGIDYNHPELDGNYNASRHAVINGVTIDGFHPDAADAHGTAVAGIIAAERNGTGVVGIAYDSEITMMPAISGAAPLSPGQAMDNWRQFDVINNSWGYTTRFYDSQFNAVNLSFEHQALFDMLTMGRDGLGTIWVKSAGNGRNDTPLDNANGSFLNSHWGSISVAAVLRTGFVTEYSSEGASNLISAFGGPIPGDIVTTDRLGAAGYSANGYTSTFNGTSAAGPMIAGIVALMLDANPNLGFRDVQEILARTARHTGSDFGAGTSGFEAYDWEWNAATQWNGGGMHYSEDYGFGLADALAAVRVAESWTSQNTYHNMETAVASSSSLPYGGLSISDGLTTSVTFTVTNNVEIESILLDLGIGHTATGDLRIRLISPSGTVSELWKNNGGTEDIPNYGSYDISLGSKMFRGEDAVGTWTLEIEDTLAGNTGGLFRARLNIFGSDTDPNDVHLFTEEYSDYDDAARTSITDTNGGIDTINAAAVFTNSTIKLTAGVNSNIDGVIFQTDGNIENIVSGDGNDNLAGNSGNNDIRGMRGNDTLLGAAGNDDLDGGTGNDFMTGGTGRDTIDASTGTDRVIFLGSADSSGVNRDLVIGMDLNADKFDVVDTQKPTIFVVRNTGALSTLTFDTDIGAAVNASFNPGADIEAVLFTPTLGNGDLAVAGNRYLIIDSNNSGTYEVGSDLVVQLLNSTGSLQPGDFI
jgi:subtilisin-like proprotein convertase family protein